jgi:hypothetical protein
LLTLPTGARIEFKSGEKPDNLYGDDVYAAVIDEASRMREESWYALRSTLTATQGKCKLIGNVKGKKNWFYKLGERARQGEAEYKYFKITAYDAAREGIISEKEIEQAKRDLPDYVFRELYLAEPADDQYHQCPLLRGVWIWQSIQIIRLLLVWMRIIAYHIVNDSKPIGQSLKRGLSNLLETHHRLWIAPVLEILSLNNFSDFVKESRDSSSQAKANNS